MTSGRKQRNIGELLVNNLQPHTTISLSLYAPLIHAKRSPIEPRIRRRPPPPTKPHWRKMVVVSSPPPFQHTSLIIPPGQTPPHSNSWSPRPSPRCRPRPLLRHLLPRPHNHSHIRPQRNLPPTRLPQQPRNTHEILERETWRRMDDLGV